MKQIKLFSSTNLECLEKEVNDFIRKICDGISHVVIDDIQFNTHDTFSEAMVVYSQEAMVVYSQNA